MQHEKHNHTENRHVSEVCFHKMPHQENKNRLYFFLLRTLFSKHGKLFPVGSNCHILLKPGILISQLSL